MSPCHHPMQKHLASASNPDRLTGARSSQHKGERVLLRWVQTLVNVVDWSVQEQVSMKAIALPPPIPLLIPQSPSPPHPQPPNPHEGQLFPVHRQQQESIHLSPGYLGESEIEVENRWEWKKSTGPVLRRWQINKRERPPPISCKLPWRSMLPIEWDTNTLGEIPSGLSQWLAEKGP